MDPDDWGKKEAGKKGKKGKVFDIRLSLQS